MKTVIYGGSFNPPHMGHLHAALNVSRYVRPDRFIIMPNHVPPYKKEAPFTPTDEERMKLCRLAFSAVPNAEVSDIELRGEGFSFTIDTLLEVHRRHPNDRLYFVVGSDALRNFHKWYCFEDILALCTLTVVSRETNDLEELLPYAKHLRDYYEADIIFPHVSPLVISSTMVREELAAGYGYEYLSDSVFDCIYRKELYNVPSACPIPDYNDSLMDMYA